MNKLEAQIVVESTGDYDEEEIEDIVEIYEAVMKHVGFEDNRIDKRFIVKFHDIFYYMPDGVEGAEVDNLFEIFCNEQYEYLIEDLATENIDIDYMLTRQCVGNYQAFIVDIPEITKDNAIDIAMKVYDEFNYNGKEYVKNYIYTVNALQNMEDHYMEDWIEFLRCGEHMPEDKIKEIEDKYNADQERRKATQTLAK